ncbi:MAG: hypothetical protein KJ606_13760 [Chloroflexi bacterium]|nr:hypothetical protein [Chloroflexota bacterium]
MDDILSTERACGRRIEGGVYAETRLSEGGGPVEFFIVDPPRPVDFSALGLTAVGVKLIEIDGVWHVFDVVGQEYYPYPADYIEETRYKGASRRLGAKLEFAKLGPESRLLLIHQKAIIANFDQYPQPPVVLCPKGLDEHQTAPLPTMCAGLWWHDLRKSDIEDGLRRLPGGVKYHAFPRPQGVTPVYEHGVFFSLPITNLVVINGGGEETEDNYQAAGKSGLPVYLEEE